MVKKALPDDSPVLKGNKEDKGMLGVVVEILKTKRFTYTMLGTSILFFVISGIQFWGTDYMRLVMEIPDEIVFPAFSIISLTAPTLGCIIGGSLTHMFGGYNHPNAIKLILYVGLWGTIVSLPVPFIKDTATFLSIFWLSLFSGGFIMPGLTGIIINSAPKKHKALANSIAYVSYNLIGYVPGPLVYGVLTHFYGPKSRIGMCVLIYSLVLWVIMVFFAYRNSSRTKVAISGFIPQVKDYNESIWESIADESLEIKRMTSKLKRFSITGGDWQMSPKESFGRQRSFLEDLITPTAGLRGSPGRKQSTLKNIERRSSSKRYSGVNFQLARKFSDVHKEVITNKLRHRRGVSLLDSTSIGMGLAGQTAANIYQIPQTTVSRKVNRRAKSIFH